MENPIKNFNIYNMKYLKLFENKSIESICEKYGINNYHINGDGTIDVYEGVSLWNKGLSEIPLKFRNVSGYFNCSWNNLTNLIGSPRRVGENFYCGGDNLLTSLEGCPEYIRGFFNCKNNSNLWSFDHFPRHTRYVYLGGTPIHPIFNTFRTEYLDDGGKNFSTSGTLMDFFWDMDPVYPGKVIIKWRLEKFLEGLNKELSNDDIKAIEDVGWKIK